MTTQPENDTQTQEREAVAQQQACSPVWRVEWQAANLHQCDGIGATVRAWQLRINGRIVLNAVAMSEIHEAVTAEDRKIIGQALAECLANDQGMP